MSHPLDGAYLTAELPEEAVLCIAHFRDDVGPVPQNPAVLFTIRVDKTQLSHSKKLIRLEHGGGSEIHGWFRREAIRVEEVIGKAVKTDAGWEAQPIVQSNVQDAGSA